MQKNSHNKVLLIRPKNIYGINNYPSLGLLSLATVLKRKGFQPIIIHAAFDHTLAKIIDHFTDTLLIGLSMMTSECRNADQFLDFLSGLSRIPIVVGGWHPTLFPQQMKRSLYVDYVIRGYGENDIVTLAQKLRNGRRAFTRVPHKEPKFINLPVVDYHLDPHLEYYIQSPLTDIGTRYHEQLRWLPYESSRGCSGRCRFCANVVAGRTKWTGKPAKQIIDEMNRVVNQYRLNHIKIIDDNFFNDARRVRDLAEQMTPGDWTWDAECRADYFNEHYLNDHLLSRLKELNLTQLTMGIESGSQASLDLMNKGITLEQAEYAVAQCDKHKIHARCSFIVEVPGESKRDIEKTRKFVNRLRRYRYFTCGVQTFRPYPRCSLTKGLAKMGLYTEPKTFKEWQDKGVVEIFTSAHKSLPWQVKPKRSSRMAAYQSMESGIAIGNHNVQKMDRKKVRLLRWLRIMAWIRNRLGLYVLPFELKLYERLVRIFHENNRCH